MQRIIVEERADWKAQAESLGFNFHTMYGTAYWDETACYRFSMKQIENDIEDPTNEIEQMCFELVSRAVNDEEVFSKLSVPEVYWDYVRNSWLNQEKNLYGRLDLSYDGTSPAKLLEYNADTPTSLYESSAFQWVWLEQAMEQGLIPAGCDQFNSIHENMVKAFEKFGIDDQLHLTACKGSEEDEGTVRYIEECAVQAGLETTFIFLEDIGIDENGHFTDLYDERITALFKLYPWEWIFKDEFGLSLPKNQLTMIEPSWRIILSNKGMLPLLWEMFEGHPNLLPAYFSNDPRVSKIENNFVKKPLFSREGGNVEITKSDGSIIREDGPYGEEGTIIQALHPLPVFDNNHTVIGSWLVASNACGIGIREDDTAITKDTSRFLLHVILD